MPVQFSRDMSGGGGGEKSFVRQLSDVAAECFCGALLDLVGVYRLCENGLLDELGTDAAFRNKHDVRLILELWICLNYHLLRHK